MKTEPNEPTYPAECSFDGNGTNNGGIQNGPHSFTFCGLTKREHFASLAMQGMLSNGMTTQEGVEPPYCMPSEKLSQMAVAFADALISALNEQK